MSLELDEVWLEMTEELLDYERMLSYEHSTYVYYSSNVLPRSEIESLSYVNELNFKDNMRLYMWVKKGTGTSYLSGGGAFTPTTSEGTTIVTYYVDELHLFMTGSCGIMGKKSVSPSGLLSGDSVVGSTPHVHEYIYSDNDDLTITKNEMDASDIKDTFELLHTDYVNNDYLTFTIDPNEQIGLNEIFGGHQDMISTSGSIDARITLITDDIYNTLSISRYVFSRTDEFSLTPENVHTVTDLETPSFSTVLSGDPLTSTVTY